MAARTRTKYEADDGTIYSISLTPDYAGVAGVPPIGAVSSPIQAKVSKSNREFGIRPRGLGLARTLGTAPNTFTKSAFLPILTSATFNSPATAIGETLTIGGVEWTVVSKRPEDY